MGLLKFLIGATDLTEKGGSIETEGIENVATNALAVFKDIMGVVMPIVLSVVLALGVFFCIKLGIAYAKTEKTEDREEAKKRLVGAVIGFAIGIAAAAIMWILFTSNALNNLFNVPETAEEATSAVLKFFK